MGNPRRRRARLVSAPDDTRLRSDRAFAMEENVQAIKRWESNPAGAFESRERRREPSAVATPIKVTNSPAPREEREDRTPLLTIARGAVVAVIPLVRRRVVTIT